MKAVLIALFAACALLLACTGGGAPAEEPATPTVEPATATAEAATPTAEPSPIPSPTVGSVEAMRRYLTDTGLDSHRGSLTDPINCAQLGDLEDIEGDFCIIEEASIYAPGLVILFVAEVDSVDDRVWQVHLNPVESAWEVADVDFVGTE